MTEQFPAAFGSPFLFPLYVRSWPEVRIQLTGSAWVEAVESRPCGGVSLSVCT
jgi:hypothetical protein